MTEQTNYSLRTHNTFGIEALAHRFITYDSVEDLRKSLVYLREKHPSEPLLHIGKGSNLLFLSDFEGTVLHSEITSIEVFPQGDDVYLRVGAGVIWDDLVAYCVAQGLYGIENLSLIPGEVGAAAVQNIGAYGTEVKDIIERVETLELETGCERVFENVECEYGYRRSIFKETLRGKYAVTFVWIKLSCVWQPNLDYGGVRRALEEAGIVPERVTAEELRKVIISIREAKLPDPKVCGNAGSFFMNPVVPQEVFESLAVDYPDMPHYEAETGRVKIPAGWLIERCGWKGRTLGRAGVHDKQALVLVNKGGATGADVWNLCMAVHDDVKQTFGIEIHPEVNCIGKL